MYTFETLIAGIIKLKEDYPFIQVKEIGRSVQNRPLYELRIGGGKKHVHINGSFHGNEWITSAIIMHFLQEFCLCLKNKQSLLGQHVLSLYESCTLCVVPMVNPDGVNLVLNGLSGIENRKEVREVNGGSLDFSSWKANIRGVDLNNQFPANWEIEQKRKIPKQPAPRDFPGFAPLTEPEAVAMATYTMKNDFHSVLAFHTQGKEIYWGYEQCEPPETEQTVNEFAKWSGYTPVKTIDSHAGYRDWFIFTQKRQGFTIELGEGVNPLPFSQFDEIYSNVRGIFLAAMYI